VKLNTWIGCFGIAVITTLAIAIAIFWPFVIFWAVNQLFNMSVVYGFKNWLACWVLLVSFVVLVQTTNASLK
jgi:hypothetical protein